MVRSMGAAIAGLLVMMIVGVSVLWLGYSLYPPPPDMDPKVNAAVAAQIARLPAGALVMELIALAAASFFGAGTAATISVRHKRLVAGFIGAVLMGLVALKFLILPYPTWVIVGALLIPLPLALLGWRVFR
jgi:hypothetical protein